MNVSQIDQLGKDYISEYLPCLENLAARLAQEPDADDIADGIQYLLSSKLIVGEILSALRASNQNAISKQQEAKELLDILNDPHHLKGVKSEKKVTKKKESKKK